MITAEPSWPVYAPDYSQLSGGMTGGQSGVGAYQIVNLTKAVTPDGQLIRLSTHTVLAAMGTLSAHRFLLGSGNAHIKGKFSRMRMLGRAVRHDHLRERQTVEKWAQDAIIVVRDRRKRNPLTVGKGYRKGHKLPDAGLQDARRAYQCASSISAIQAHARLS